MRGWTHGMLWLGLALLSGAAAPPARVAERPPRKNVLFIVSDDLNPSLGCYGSPVVKTPNIDRLAARAVRFDRAYCQYPLCNPSRASFLSGLRTESSGITGNETPPRRSLPEHVFLPEHFRRHGYFTAGVGKIFHHSSVFGGRGEVRDMNDAACWTVSEMAVGKDDPDGYGSAYASTTLAEHPVQKAQILRGETLQPRSRPVADYWLEWAALDVPDEETSEGVVARRAAALVEQAQRQGKPFFVAAGFRKPHLLWTAPPRYLEMVRPEQVSLPEEPAEHLAQIPRAALSYGPDARPLPPDERRRAIAAYFANIAFMDAQVGVLLEKLDRLKLWDDTIVVFFGDHGWHLGEHGGLWGKMTLFEGATRTPLLIAAPGKARGAASPRLAELVDLYPTLAQLCGLPVPERLEGTSLAPVLEQPARPWKKAAFSVLRKGEGYGRAVRTERYRYVEWPDGAAQLYDYDTDPRELRNLAADPKYAGTVAEMRRRLEAGWRSAGP